MFLWFLVILLNGIKPVKNVCPDCLLNTEISRLSSFAVPFPLPYSRGLIKAPVKSVLWGFQVSTSHRDWQEFANHLLYTCFSLVCKVDLKGWNVKEAKEQAEKGKNIISYAWPKNVKFGLSWFCWRLNNTNKKLFSNPPTLLRPFFVHCKSVHEGIKHFSPFCKSPST